MAVIKLKRSSTPGDKPTSGDLQSGELFINTADAVIYFESSGGVVTPLASFDSDTFLGYYDSLVASGDITGDSIIDSDILLPLYNSLVANGDITSSSTLDSDTLLPLYDSLIANGDIDTSTQVDSDWVNSRIADHDHTYFDSDIKAVRYIETIKTVTQSGSSATLDLKTANIFSLTMNDPVTFTFSNAPTTTNGYGFTLKVTQDAFSAFAITWPASVRWSAGTAPTAPGAGETDVYTFFTVDGGSNWYGVQTIDAAA